MDSSRKTGSHGIANDTGTGTENGRKGGIEGLKEEAEMSGKDTMKNLSTENLKVTEGMKVTGEATKANKD